MHLRLEPASGNAQLRPSVLLRRLRHYLAPAMLVFALVLALGLAMIALMPARYESEARLLALPADYYTIRGDPQRPQGNEAFRPEDVMNVEMQLLSSQDLRRAAIERAGIAPADHEAFQQALDGLGQRLSILPVAQANVIELSLAETSPQRARAMLETVLAVYFELRADVLNSGRVEILTRQRDEARGELRRANQALSDFQRQNNVVDIEAQIAGAVALDTALRQNLAEARALLSGSQGALLRQRSSAANVPSTIEIFRDDTEATRARAEIEARILQLQAERGDLAQRFMSGSPLIERIDSQINALRRSLGDLGASLPEARRIGRNSAYDVATGQVRESEAAVSGTSAQVERLMGEIVDSETRLLQLNALAVEIADLKVQRDVSEERFRSLAEQLEAARAREFEAGTGSTNVRIIQQPTLPTSQVLSPLTLLAGAVVAGLLLAGGALFALMTWRSAPVDGADAAEIFGLPLLADLSAKGRNGRDNRPAILSLAALRPARGASGGAAPDAGGQVIALVGAGPGEYRDPVAGLIARFCDDGATAIVGFEAGAYRGQPHSQKLPHQIAGSPDRFMAGTIRWLEDGRAERFLGRLRQNYRWIIVFVPAPEAMAQEGPANEAPQGKAGVPNVTEATLDMADHIAVLVSAGRTPDGATRRLLDHLAGRGTPARALVVTRPAGSRWPRSGR